MNASALCSLWVVPFWLAIFIVNILFARLLDFLLSSNTPIKKGALLAGFIVGPMATFVMLVILALTLISALIGWMLPPLIALARKIGLHVED